MIKYRQLRKSDKEIILKMYHEYYNYHDIAEKIGYPYNSVARFLAKQGLDRQIRNNKKQCSRCKTWLPLENFGLNNALKHRLNSACRDCINDEYKSAEENVTLTTDIIDNPERIVEYKSFKIYIKNDTYVLRQHRVTRIYATPGLDSFYATMLSLMISSCVAEENQLIMFKHARKIKKLLKSSD